MKDREEELTESEIHTRVSVSHLGRTIYFFDDVDNHSVAEAFKILQLLETKNPKEPIKFIINSGGGDVYSGLALYDRIKISPCKIITVGAGFIASMGLIIFLAGEERAIVPNAVLMHHQNSMSMYGMRTSDVKIEAKEITRLENITNNIVSTTTGQAIKQLKEGIRDGDKYITPAEALTMGYAHKMLPYRIQPKPAVKKGK